MRKFIVGERYKVGGDSYETGNIIEITKVDCTWCYYKNIESECTFDRFMPNSSFGRALILVTGRKFKIGDIVIGNDRADDTYSITRKGYKGTVTDVLKNGKIKVNHFSVLEECFDLFEEKIVVTRNGKKTIAEYYINDKLMKKGLAKCCPEDEFDFETGAKLAVFRMFEAMKNSAFDWNAFAAGKIKKAVTRENIDAFLKECDAHDLTWGYHKASEWNPFKTKDEIFSLSKSEVFSEFLKELLGTVLDLPETIYISVVDGFMKFSDKESTFDWEKFKNHEIAVKVTPENVMEFLQEAEKNGCHWRTGKLPTELNPYETLINTEPLHLYGFSFDSSGNFGYEVIEPEDLEIVEW